jgi:hypothetical protein
MSKIVGYMLTWTTYGSWLPGDERRYVADGKITEGDKDVFERNKKRQKKETVKLKRSEKQLVRNVILSEA